ncbi:MAG: HNH endonuclease signature motif containing protein [Rhodospirillaceae bacterium]|nr:HNH endonuclease signature motif containing protein [Rhodospirillaceae bacterium]
MSKLHSLHGLGGERWERVRQAIFRRDGYRCRECGRYGPLECDHIKPLKSGGEPWDPANLQSLCRDCHAAKTERETVRRGGAAFFRARAKWKRALQRALEHAPQGETTE